MAPKRARKRPGDSRSSPRDPDLAPDPKRARIAEESASMEYPPHETLVKVFSHLNTQDKGRAAMVCQWWRRVLNDPGPWKDDEVTMDLDKLTEEGETSLKTRQVKHIKILQCAGIQKLQSLLQGLPDLQTLFLVKAENVDADTLIKVFSRKMEAMKELHLPLSNSALMKTVCSNMPNLKMLRLQCHVNSENKTAIDNLDLSFLSQAPMPSLEDLALTAALLSDTEIECFVKGFPKLKVLIISLGPGTTEAGIKMLSELPSLKSLALIPLTRSGVVLEPLLRGDAKLRDLIFWGSFKRPVAISISQMTSLETLRIGYVKNYHLEIFSQGLPNLIHLMVESETGDITLGLRHLAKMSQLKLLTLCRVKILSNEMRLLSEGLKELKILVLVRCPVIRDKGLLHISTMTSLQHLCIYDSEFSVKGLMHLSKSDTLQRLNIHGCPAIPDDCYKELPEHIHVSQEYVEI